MVEKTPNEPSEPITLGDVLAELAQYHAPYVLKEAERRRLAAQQLSQRHLVQGAAEHHQELLNDPAADPDSTADSRRGLQGDEADLLAIDPTAHDGNKGQSE